MKLVFIDVERDAFEYHGQDVIVDQPQDDRDDDHRPSQAQQ